MAYVTEDGNFGGDEILEFKEDQLSKKQWELLDELSDEDRLPFVRAVLAGEDLSEWEY